MATVSNEQIAALLTEVTHRLAAIEAKIGGATASGGAASNDDVAPATSEFDSLVAKFGVGFQEASAKLGADAKALVRGCAPMCASGPDLSPRRDMQLRWHHHTESAPPHSG